MQAIRTRFVGPSRSHGAKIRASCASANLTVTYDHSMDANANHRAAAKALVEKLEAVAPGCWEGQWVGGQADGDMYWVSLMYKDVTVDTFTVPRETKIG